MGYTKNLILTNFFGCIANCYPLLCPNHKPVSSVRWTFHLFWWVMSGYTVFSFDHYKVWISCARNCGIVYQASQTTCRVESNTIITFNWLCDDTSYSLKQSLYWLKGHQYHKYCGTLPKVSRPWPKVADLCCLSSWNFSSNVSLARASPNTPVTFAPTPASPPVTHWYVTPHNVWTHQMCPLGTDESLAWCLPTTPLDQVQLHRSAHHMIVMWLSAPEMVDKIIRWYPRSRHAGTLLDLPVLQDPVPHYISGTGTI